MVPLLDGGDDVAMVLSPQTFHNINRHTDIFNHFNVQFWEYAQHGYDAIGFISCTGQPFSAAVLEGSHAGYNTIKYGLCPFTTSSQYWDAEAEHSVSGLSRCFGT